MKKLLRSVFVFVLAFSLVLGTGAFTNVGTINVNAATEQAKITQNSKWSTQQPYYNAKRGVPLTAMFKEAKLPFVGSSPTCRSISLGINSNSK